MSVARDCLDLATLKIWQPRPDDVSAKSEIGLGEYRASRVVLIPVSSAEYDGLRLIARKPIGVKIEASDDGVSAENDSLHIHAYGASCEEALEDFRSQLFELYNHYSKLGESDVMGRAVRLRNAFTENFTLVPVK